MGSSEEGSIGIALDIDGVIMRGGAPLQGALEAIEKIKKYNIPHIFMTNNGMETESERVVRLSKSLGIDIDPRSMIMCHSSLKYEAEEIGDGLVLVTGITYGDTSELMKNLGFKNVHTTFDYVCCYLEILPLKKYPQIRDRSWAEERVEVVIMIEMPMDWHQDLQLICDLMQNKGYCSSSNSKPDDNTDFKPKMIACNFDLSFPGKGTSSQLFGPGAFLEALQALYTKVTKGEKMNIVAHGKPFSPMYKMAQDRLSEILASEKNGTNGGLKRIYAIGDNPESDIRGANNAGYMWTSVLVRSGCYIKECNDETDPADYFFKDVTEFVDFILKKEKFENEN